MIPCRLRTGLFALALLPTLSHAQERSATQFAAEDFARLHRLVKPQPGEARWEQVPWMPANDLWAARQKAAQEGKPLLLWYMAGEPLGTC